MIPLRDNIPSRTYPFVNITLIVVNVVVFLYQLMLGPELNLFVREFAVIPFRYFHDAYITARGGMEPASAPDLVIPLFSSMFMHGGWLHLIGNMAYLWIFGDNVEDRLGHGRYLVFYLSCGVAASTAHIWFNPNSRVPSLGASGAIAGVLSAYLLLYPKALVLVLIPIWFIYQAIEVPAVFFLGFWFIQQFFYGVFSLGIQSAQTGGVAWWAHIGGFITGALLLRLMAPRRYRPVSRDIWA